MLSIGALVSTACASTHINRILADPSHYRDRQVRVSGSVVDSYSFANRGAYRLGDDSGQLWVVSDKGVPRKGARPFRPKRDRIHMLHRRRTDAGGAASDALSKQPMADVFEVTARGLRRPIS